MRALIFLALASVGLFALGALDDQHRNPLNPAPRDYCQHQIDWIIGGCRPR